MFFWLSGGPGLLAAGGVASLITSHKSQITFLGRTLFTYSLQVYHIRLCPSMLEQYKVISSSNCLGLRLLKRPDVLMTMGPQALY